MPTLTATLALSATDLDGVEHTATTTVRWSRHNGRACSILTREGDRFAARHDAQTWEVHVLTTTGD